MRLSFPRHNLNHFKAVSLTLNYKYYGIQMKKTFPSFDLRIDHLFPSEPEERKQKKEEQQRFACLDVSELDDLVCRTVSNSSKPPRV